MKLAHAIASTMLSLYGSAYAATAAAPATIAAAHVPRSVSSVHVSPINASTPAKPMPYSGGMRSPSTMPTIDSSCHDDQFTATPPQ